MKTTARLVGAIVGAGLCVGGVAGLRLSDAHEGATLAVETGHRAPPADPPPVDLCAVATWVAAWSAPPQDTTAAQPPHVLADDDAPPLHVFEDQTLRLIVTPSGGGSRTRLHLSNRFGATTVTFGAVRVARAAGQGTIVAGTARAVTFAGSPSARIAPGGMLVSDPVDLAVEPFVDLAVSIHVADAAALDVHLFAQQAQYATSAGAGDLTDEISSRAFTTRLSSMLALAAVDVLAPRRTGAVVALGDSITDGLGSSMDGNQRWPDQLARRILAEPEGPALTVVNAGISGNQVTRDNVLLVNGAGYGMGPSTVSRFGPDVVDRTGATDVVLFVGINDLYMPTTPDPPAAIIDGYRAIVERARSAGLRVIGTTMTPGGLAGDREAQRQQVNEWIRHGAGFDHVVDLDAVVRDPENPAAVAPGLAADPVHLNDAGYAAVAGAFDLGLFRGTGCALAGG